MPSSTINSTIRRKSGRPLNYNRSRLDSAVRYVLQFKLQGKAVSVRDAADRFKVPKSTLHRHLKIANQVRTPHSAEQTVSPPRKCGIPFLLQTPQQSDSDIPVAVKAPYTRVHKLHQMLHKCEIFLTELHMELDQAKKHQSLSPSMVHLPVKSPMFAAAHSGHHTYEHSYTAGSSRCPSSASISYQSPYRQSHTDRDSAAQ